MKKKMYEFFTSLAITTFLVYWLSVFMVTLPANPINKKISGTFPRFTKIFSSSWKLFSPPYTNHNRLYFIVRKINQQDMIDTIEVIEKISIQKQNAAPFNQRENIIDYCLYNNVGALVKIVWKNKKKPGQGFISLTDSFRMVNTMKELWDNKKYIAYLNTLKNYCSLVLKENKIDTMAKEVKIIIKEKMITPFKEINNSRFVPTETLVFETPFESINQ